jgi:hypothetical protein
MVENLLAERRRILRLEAEFAPVDWDDGQTAMEIERSIYSLHEEWAAEAEQVLLRVRRLAAQGLHVKDAGAMEDAYASGLARLKFTAEKTARGIQQARRDEFTPAQELRNELRARLRT